MTEATSISAGLRQRLQGKLYLGLNGGYGTTTYHSSTLAPSAANIGNYDSTFFGASLSTAFSEAGHRRHFLFGKLQLVRFRLL